MINKIVLAGGSGHIGRILTGYFKGKCADLVILTRGTNKGLGFGRQVHWEGDRSGYWERELIGCDLLVNLSGKNVNCRYTAGNRNEILQSRLKPTAVLGAAVRKMDIPPKVWINLTSATIFRHAEDRPQDEATGEIGSGFSVDVCTAWEGTFLNQATPGTRKVVLRTGMVLGRGGSVLPRLLRLCQAGIGGHQGSGRQYISWIHETDLSRIVEWAYVHAPDGAIWNAVAPEPVRNNLFMKQLRTICGIPFGLSAPKWLLEIGALLIGTETELVLKSRWVVPKALLEAGFRFRYPDSEAALRQLLVKETIINRTEHRTA
ncbi:MAG TPA: TIGR01777 family oxidoreductase [Chitinophagaceae bacterium]|jgi:hypothetical protein|nr:TIGR01777 family oxidoreductase [Chitinophagaceae bacterium]